MYKLLFAITILTGSINAFAEDMSNTVTGTMSEEKNTKLSEQKWRAGITSGFNSPKGDIATTPEFGITTAFQPWGQVGLGLDAGTSKLDDASQAQRTTVFVNALYNVGGDIPVLRTSYLGAGGGPVFKSSKVYWGYGPVAGFDIPFNQKTHETLSLGLTAKYIINTDTPDSLAAAAAIKYWF